MRKPPPPRNVERERKSAKLVDAIAVVERAAQSRKVHGASNYTLLHNMTAGDVVAAAATLLLVDELAELGKTLRAAKGVVVIDPKRVAALANGGAA